MVRIGTLPMRLLSLQYGADIVYCEVSLTHLQHCSVVKDLIADTTMHVIPKKHFFCFFKEILNQSLS